MKYKSIDGKKQSALWTVKQCWICESEGEIKNYDQEEVDTFIWNLGSQRLSINNLS